MTNFKLETQLVALQGARSSRASTSQRKTNAQHGGILECEEKKISIKDMHA